MLTNGKTGIIIKAIPRNNILHDKLPISVIALNVIIFMPGYGEEYET